MDVVDDEVVSLFCREQDRPYVWDRERFVLATPPPLPFPWRDGSILGAPPESIRDALQKRSVDTNAQGAKAQTTVVYAHDCQHLPLPPSPTYYRWERLITTATTASG